MVSDREDAVCRLDELERGMPKLVTVRGRKVVLVRIAGEVFALQNACPHKGAPLCEGTVSEARAELICPWHRFRFGLRDGRSVTNPELSVPTFETRVTDGSVFITIPERTP